MTAQLPPFPESTACPKCRQRMTPALIVLYALAGYDRHCGGAEGHREAAEHLHWSCRCGHASASLPADAGEVPS